MEKTQSYLVGIKPKKQTELPKKPLQRKNQKAYLSEVMTYATNTAKWKSAERYCRDRLWKFKLITEHEYQKFSEYVAPIEGKKLSTTKIRQEIFLSLYDNATENPSVGKWYLFEYDPKFKDQLKVWDQYPLVQVMEFKKGNLLGANIHHLKVRSRLGAINNNRFPQSILRYYIPKKADGLFFEVDDMDVPKVSFP